MSLSSSSSSESPLSDIRINSLEQRLDRADTRMEKYDQLLVEIQHSLVVMQQGQDRSDLMLQTFINEMKEMKQREIDLGKLLETNTFSIIEQKQKWDLFLTVGKYLLWLIASITLLYIGATFNHLINH